MIGNEPVFTMNQNELTQLKVDESLLGQQLEDKIWKKVKHHLYLTSTTTVEMAIFCTKLNEFCIANAPVASEPLKQTTRQWLLN